MLFRLAFSFIKYIINPDGVRWFKEHYKGDEINVITIGIYVPLEERKRRCKDRSDFNSSFIKRVKDYFFNSIQLVWRRTISDGYIVILKHHLPKSLFDIHK